MSSVFTKAVCGALMLGATFATSLPAAHAQGISGCAVVLRAHDGFLAVRSGPGVHFNQFDSLFPGQIAVLNGAYQGPWRGIRGVMDSVGEPPRRLFGWVHSSYLSSVNC